MTLGTSLPLEGVRVLDCTQVLAGPFCSQLLADMGADVIKVERPDGGDETRKGPPYINGRSASFLAVNRNKRGLALDLRRNEGQEVLKALCATADVLVENFRPGTMQRLGLGYEDLEKLRPELIYCSISGFGQTGPYSSRGGFDLIAQGMSGLMSVTGTPGGPPAKVGVPITDLTAGMYGAYGILSAYIHRLKTGKGQQVDISLMEAGIAYTVWESTVYFATGEVPGPLGSAHRLSAPYRALRTSDGYITIGGAAQVLWEKMCNAIGRAELLDDPRFGSRGDRKANDDELAELLEETFSTKTTEHWMEVLEQVGVPAGPINDLDQVYHDPHVQARRMEVDLDDPELGLLRNIGIPVKLSNTPGSIRHRGPALGEHTREVLEDGGFTTGEIDALLEAGVVKAS
ncbi:MAG: CoA transferase [Dehalococcoidia bacterium]|nr:CoA transferase [Dehalococcoidia bacterium]